MLTRKVCFPRRVGTARDGRGRVGRVGTGGDGWGRGGWTAGRRATGAVGGGQRGVIRGVGGSEGVGGLYMLPLDATNTYTQYTGRVRQKHRVKTDRHRAGADGCAGRCRRTRRAAQTDAQGGADGRAGHSTDRAQGGADGRAGRGADGHTQQPAAAPPPDF